MSKNAVSKAKTPGIDSTIHRADPSAWCCSTAISRRTLQSVPMPSLLVWSRSAKLHTTRNLKASKTQGRILLQQSSDKSLPPAFTADKISAALQKTKPATAPNYDHVHIEFLKHLGSNALSWLSKFSPRMMVTSPKGLEESKSNCCRHA